MIILLIVSVVKQTLQYVHHMSGGKLLTSKLSLLVGVVCKMVPCAKLGCHVWISCTCCLPDKKRLLGNVDSVSIS